MALPDAALHPNVQRKVFSGLLLVFIAILSVLTITLPYNRDDKLGPIVDQELLDLVDTGDTAWMLTSCALVLLMTPGLAFFYGGMVRSKNLLSTLLQSVFIMGVVGLLWTFVGFSLAFGKDADGIVGSPVTYFLLRNVGAAPETTLAGTIPLTVYCMFQMTFAMITSAIITGAVVERANFNAMMLFTALWHILVYCPMAHMEWSPNGLIKQFGSHDYAGGTVVHMSAGFSALTLSLLLGKRGGDKSTHHAPAHIPYVILGTALLWFGWAGFNAGSNLASGAGAGHALLTTNISVCASMVTWVLWDYIQGRKVSAIGTCAGVVVGLVGITPACGYVTVGGALLIGMITAIICNITMKHFQLNDKFDDTLDVFAGHGMGGLCGMILTALFSSTRVFADDLDGLFYGKAELFWKTVVTAALVIVYFVVATIIIYYITNALITFRVSEEEEMAGLDSSVHGEVVHGFMKGEGLGSMENGGSFNKPLKATGGTAVTGSPVDSVVA